MGAPKAEIPDNQREFRLQTIHHSLMPTIYDNRLIGDIHADFESQKIHLDSILPKIRMKSLTQPADIIQWAQFTFLDIHSTPTNTTIPIETLSETQKTISSMLLERRILLSKGCLWDRGRVSMRHFLWRHGRADLDFCFSISLSEALQTDFSLGRRVSRSAHKEPLSLIYIYYYHDKFCSSRHFAFLRKCAFGAIKSVSITRMSSAKSQDIVRKGLKLMLQHFFK